MNEGLAPITEEFLESELDKTIQLSKNGGPYSKLERINRRKEVFQLHFEQGYSAIKIAEIMRVNRHTVSKDIEFWYNELTEEFGVDETNLILKHTYRLETQRTRFLDELKIQNRFHERIILEKMIIDIDSKIAHMKLKSITTKEHIIKTVIDLVNKIHSEPDKNAQWINTAALYKVSRGTEKKVMELIKDDQRNRANYYLEEQEENQNS
ncbi:MAG: hypothetical protein HOD60_14545 [Candidatus Nitrosopelagicus sp.]|nr:hypothetical protein [Candidatus Nitrosopelagicus sp.]